jgi:hypothetical protein
LPIRRREIGVENGATWRDPEEDVPADFETNQDVGRRWMGTSSLPT